MTISELKSSNCIVFECLSGSKAQGLATADSDTDIRGVFVLPAKQFFGNSYLPQVSDERNDTVYYELGRFVELLSKNNPNALELLCTPDEFVLKRAPMMDLIPPALFMSKRCHKTFVGYASTQIGKAKGLNKKINNPMPKTRPTVLDFCFVTDQRHTKSLTQLLEENSWRQEDCGLSKMAKMPDMYALFHHSESIYEGIFKGDNANDVCLSSIPKEEKMVAYVHFRKSAYSKYCRKHREYWDWVEKRNESRYQSTISHGKQYDAKNMMHTIRLLRMAKEIAETGAVVVKREDRDELLAIRSGEFSYEKLIEMSEALMSEIECSFATSDLPATPDLKAINQALVQIRTDYYGH
jgi:predicted nucleotidyltransferase